jgi:hypothetical protein
MARAPKKNSTGKETARPQPEPYTTRIIKAGALLNDTKTLLSHWDSGQSVKDNLRRFQKDNLFGKASRSRVEDILRIFRQRYLKEEEVTRALVVLVQRRFPAAGLDRILYYHAAKADCLLHDVVTEILPTRTAQGISDIDVIDLQHELAKWVAQRRTTTQWSEPTTRRVAQGLLSTLRDFGVLAGAVNKQIAPAYLPVCSPAILQGEDALPLPAVPSDYPLAVDSDGILIDDAKHQDDVVRVVREVMEFVWKEGADSIERELCEMLSVKRLRDYFRKPGKGGFWDDHVSRYSKSRRKGLVK